MLAHYQERFEHVLVDEYQDTNRAQNEIVLKLAAAHHNVCVVGDSDQCLPPGTLVSTPDGEVPIEAVAEGDLVLGTGGALSTLGGVVTAAVEGQYDGPMVEVRAGGRTIRGTPHHLVPARLTFPRGLHLVYLMYRADRGYRVGPALTERRRRLDPRRRDGGGAGRVAVPPRPRQFSERDRHRRGRGEGSHGGPPPPPGVRSRLADWGSRARRGDDVRRRHELARSARRREVGRCGGRARPAADGWRSAESSTT